MKQTTEHKLQRAREFAIKKYGSDYVNLGTTHYRLNVARTPSLMLDYKLGIGGFPYGHGVEIFGANKLGKSSALAYGVMGNVQKEVDSRDGDHKIPALIATEPRMVTPSDKEWALRLGLDPDKAIIWYPDDATEAFDMLRDLVFGNLANYIVIDSLGGMGTASGAKEDGKKKAFGISGEVTAGLNDIMPRLYKNNIGLMLINQQRQGQSPTPGMKFYDSPGGEALKHHMRIRIQVKPGTNKFTANIDDDKVMVGQELICKIIKNNIAQGQGKEARFNFYHIETSEQAIGIDHTQDIINTGMVCGVMKKDGSNYLHETFPKGKLFGKPKVQKFLQDNPDAYEKIRQDVMEIMVTEELKAKQAADEAAKRAATEVEETDD